MAGRMNMLKIAPLPILAAATDRSPMLKLATLSVCLLISTSVLAQKSVYRCETAGKVSYSHEPCVGAKEIDATPTQGMDKMTGQSRKGRDVLRHEQDGVMADALKSAGKPFEHIVMKDEAHYFSRGTNRVQMLEALETFLAKSYAPS